MSVPEDEGMVRVGLIAYACPACNAFQLFGGEFSKNAGVLNKPVCIVVRGESGYMCGAKLDQISANNLLLSLSRGINHTIINKQIEDLT